MGLSTLSSCDETVCLVGEALKLIKPNRKTEAQSHNKLNKNVDNSYEAPSDNSPNGRNDAKVAKQVKLKMLI